MPAPARAVASLLAAAALLASAAGGCRGDHTLEALAHVRSGDAALETGDLDGAVSHYERAIDLRDELPQAWVGLGRALASFAVAAARAGELDRARELAGKAAAAFRTAVKLEPEGVEGYAGLGAAYGFLGQPEKAYPVFLRLAELRPHDPRAHEALAITLTDLGRFADAIPHFGVAVEAKPDDAGLLLKLGRALVGIDRAAEALPILMRVHELSPEDPRYLEVVGDAFLSVGAGAEALEAFKRLGESGPGMRLDALRGMGMAHLAMGDPAAAEERFGEGLELLGRHGVKAGGEAIRSKEVRDTLAGFHYGRARALMMAKREAEAVEALRATLKVDEGHVPAMTLLGGALAGLERHDEAIEVLDRLVKKAPWSEVAATLHADVLAMRKRFGEAKVEYERAVRLSPDGSTLLNNFAWMLVTAEDRKYVDCGRAVELAERAVTLSDFRSAPALDTLAEAYHCVGRPADALRTIEKAIHVTPGDEMLYERRDKYAAALPAAR